MKSGGEEIEVKGIWGPTSEIDADRGQGTSSRSGVIREVGDGVARIEGLDDAMLNEMIDLGTVSPAGVELTRPKLP